MNVAVNPGKYIVAVSGGVDSVVLLDVLAGKPGLDLLVAHVDHGIRPNSADDAEFVKNLAAKYGLPFYSQQASLGPDASEDEARILRYGFLRQCQQEHGAAGIILAHHQDDVLETAIHNVIRGTGRRGLTSLRSTQTLLRPLLHVPKQSLIDYAVQQKLSWREDTTNHDERYTRNYIRHRLLVRFDADARQRMIALITQMTDINDELDSSLEVLMAAHTSEAVVDRRWFCSLDHAVAKEVLAGWLRDRGIRDFTSSGLERLTVGLKVAVPGSRLDIMAGYSFSVSLPSARLLHRDDDITLSA